LSNLPAIFVVFPTFEISISDGSQTKPAEATPAKRTLHMFTRLEMFKNNKTVRTGSELRGHIVSIDSSLSIFHSKLLVPRAVSEILLHGTTFFIPTMLRIVGSPFA